MKTEANGVVAGEVRSIKTVDTKAGRVVKLIVRATNTKARIANDVEIEGWGEEGKKIDCLRTGDLVRVHVRINSRIYNGRYFTNLHPYSIECQRAVVPGADDAPEGRHDPHDVLPENEPLPF